MPAKMPGRSNKVHATPTGLPALLSIAQVADATGLSTRTIRRRISDETLRAHRIGPRTIRIERDSVLALLVEPIGCGA
jgi:excisionase family DNA binding protein